MLHLNTPKSPLRGVVMALAFLLNSNAQALQLGQPALQSQLGQPLKLEVQISDLTAQEAQDFQAVLADETVYQTAKINRVAGLENITLTLTKRSEDVYVLQMLGTEPLVSPYVDVLLEFRWATGRSFRNIGFPLSGTLNNTPKGLVAAEPPPAPVAAKQPARPAPLPKASDTPTEAASSQPKETASALPEDEKVF